MLAGLSAVELGRLKMSVGYGTHKKGRPLSPVEVGKLIYRIKESENGSTEACAKAINIDKSGVSRFLKILDLPKNIQHLVSWGTQKGSIGFSAATQLARFDTKDQDAVVKSILSEGLNSKEIGQVAQLKNRSGRDISACLKEVLGMRPIIERRHVFIGTIYNPDVESILLNLTQAERDQIIKSSINAINLDEVSGRLGEKFFTLVGSDSLSVAIQNMGPDNLEEEIIVQIQKCVKNV